MSDTLEVGDDWTITLSVADGSTVAAQVTNPSGDTATVTPVVTEGEVTISVPLTEGGRYLAVVTVVTDGVPDVTPYTVFAEEPGGHIPTVPEIRDYLDSNGGTSARDEDIDQARTAELANQAKVCSVPATYPPDLAEALCRRVARNLAARAQPLAQITSFDSGQVVNRVPRTDPEVVRLEGPYLRVVVA
jgi:hypothetical protein